MTLLTLAILVLIALILEGFFSGAEMALISADRLALHKQAQLGSSGAKTALKLLSKPENVLATTLVGTNLCVAFQATITTIYIYNNFGADYEIFSVIVLSPILLIFGEIIPKTIYQRYAESLAPKIAPLVLFAKYSFAPIIWLLEKYTDKLSKALHPIETALTGKHRPSHREELRYLLTYGQKETSLKTSEKRMIRRILDFSRAEAKNALIPLIQVDMIEDNLTIKDALLAFIKFKHSRLPVYHERVDNIVGIVHVFDIFRATDLKKPITEVMKSCYYAPESQQLEKLLITMQKLGIQMSIIVDEYGGGVGILTLEDILEEIVGEIKDEYDHDTSLFRDLGDDTFLVQAQTEIESVNEALKISIPRGHYETLAGFLLLQFDRIPEEGDELYYSDLKFTVRKSSQKQIQLVEIKKITG